MKFAPLGFALFFACTSHGPAPCDMASAPAADLSVPSCLPPGAPCDKLKPPACCDGIACGLGGHCLAIGPVRCVSCVDDADCVASLCTKTGHCVAGACNFADAGVP